VTAKTKEGRKPRSSRPRAPETKGGGDKSTGGSGRAGPRLRPGELDGLVLSYLTKHKDELPLGPTAVAKGIGRSAGAVGNCLERLAKTKKVRRAGRKPKTFDLKGVGDA
jgi:hypothetical protein